jgi:uncharacterized protein YcfL
MWISEKEGLMRLEFSLKAMKKYLPLIMILLAGYCFVGCMSNQSSAININRAGTLMDDGKLFVYLDGKQINQKQPIGKGQTRTISISNGKHRIWVMVDNLESDKIQFTTENNSVSFNVSTERIGGSKVLLIQRSIDEK